MLSVKGLITPHKQIVLQVGWFNPLLIATDADGDFEPKKGDSVIAGALVDTGATKSCITKALAEKMRLLPDGSEPVLGVHGPKTTSTYTVGVFIAELNFILPELKVYEVGNLNEQIQSILGMDILLQGTFQLDKQQNFTFSV